MAFQRASHLRPPSWVVHLADKHAKVGAHGHHFLARIRCCKACRAVDPRSADRSRPSGIFESLLDLLDSSVHWSAVDYHTLARARCKAIVEERRVCHDAQAERLSMLRIQRVRVPSFGFDDLDTPLSPRLLIGREQSIRIATQVLDLERIHDLVRILRITDCRHSLQRAIGCPSVDVL